MTGPSEGADAEIARQLAILLGRLHAFELPDSVATPRSPVASTEAVERAIAERERITGEVAAAFPDVPGLAASNAPNLTRASRHACSSSGPPMDV